METSTGNSRRKLLKALTVGGSAVAIAKIPPTWSTPLIESATLPVHAQTTEPEPTLYAIGDTGPCGGIVFYITDGGLHGLEAAPVDQSASAAWGCSGTSIPGATSTGIGAGAGNTAAILAGCATAGIAARVAVNYTGGGCMDWFLPSEDELNELYQQRAVVGGFANDFYWSYTELRPADARRQYFVNGAQSNINKSNSLRVRAVRAV